MDRINLLETGFLYLEAPETPMHVAGLSLFKFPDRANQRKFMAQLGDGYRGVANEPSVPRRTGEGATGRRVPRSGRHRGVRTA